MQKLQATVTILQNLSAIQAIQVICMSAAKLKKEGSRAQSRNTDYEKVFLKTSLLRSPGGEASETFGVLHLF